MPPGPWVPAREEACGTVQLRSIGPEAARCQATGAAKAFYTSINRSAISVVLPVSGDGWLLYLMSIIKLLQPENIQQQKTKLSIKINIIEVNV